MRTSVRWSETAEAVNGVRPPINSVAYSPSGDYVVASCGVRVLVYAASTGTLLHSLKGHQDTVYCVDYSSDGKRFASGGADKLVIVWTHKGEGTVKYQHKESIQALAANPTSSQIASISSVDWGLWAPELPKVTKRPLPSKGLCAAWTLDGLTLTIGTLDGTVLILDKGTEEKHRIRRSAPVWALAFNPLRENGVDVLTVGSWDQRLSFYNLTGAAVGKEKELDCDPCSISYYDNGEYILISGSDHKVTLFTRDGNRLVNVADSDDWVWSAKQRPRHKQICCGTNDGTISSIEVSVTTVHCIYQDQYVCRDKMTDVVVHQLTLDRKMRIPCNDYVRKLATYRDRLAVQFQDRIVIFELFYDDERNMRYQDIAQVRKKLECSMLCVTANALVLCKERRLTLYDFQGNKRREWVMDSVIRYMKVAGGVEGREMLLVGLKSGQAVKVFVDNPFPTQLLTVNSAIHCLDLSSSRTKLAVVDENNLLQVFDLEHKNEVVFSETNAKAVAWNTDFEDMIAYSTGGNTLNIKTGALEPYQQPMHGVVVGFKANRVFNLYYANMIVVDVPHAHALYHYIEERNFEAAYQIASLGVTDSDWKMLGMHAMTALELDIARRAFTHIHEVKFVELLNELELARRQKKDGGSPATSTTQEQSDKDGLLLADILAFQGKYQDAARQFLKSGNENRAIDMFCDLKMWDDARKVCSDQNHLKELIRQQARWAEDSQNFVEAASLYETCGDYAKAVAMLGQSGQVDKLMSMCRSLPKTEIALITQCAVYFRQQGSIPYALEAYEKVGDNRALIQIYVEMGDWRQAFAILDRHPQFARDVYVPWANWLADNDKFEEAVEAFRAAKWPQEAVRMMETLASNSVTCRKFRDAAFYYVHLASEYGQFEDDEKLSESQLAYRIKLSNDCMRKADMYYVYSAIYTHATQPLPYNELKLFRMARYLLAMCSDNVIPVNIGKAEVLHTLARSANRLDMIRTARAVFEKLQSVILPLPIMEQVDIETLIVRGKSFVDREELLDTCYRCKQVVPQLTEPGDRCPNCFHPFVRSFVQFEALPLVEFSLANDVSDEEAERLIRTGLGLEGGVGHSAQTPSAAGRGDGGAAKKDGDREWQADTGANVMSFEQDNIDYEIDRQLMAMGKTKAAANRTGDPFVSQLQYITRTGRPKGVYTPFVVTMDMIRNFHRDEVFIVKPPYGALPAPNRYYRLMKTDAHITQCEGCQHFFTSDEYECECMKGFGCPLCRFRPGRQVSRSLREVMVEMENAKAVSPSQPQ